MRRVCPHEKARKQTHKSLKSGLREVLPIQQPTCGASTDLICFSISLASQTLVLLAALQFPKYLCVLRNLLYARHDSAISGQYPFSIAIVDSRATPLLSIYLTVYNKNRPWRYCALAVALQLVRNNAQYNCTYNLM
jgi:hypothetical protein